MVGASRALSVGSPVEVFAIRLAALVNLGPSDASDAVCAELDGWLRGTYVVRRVLDRQQYTAALQNQA